jgi:hypothetical protein
MIQSNVTVKIVMPWAGFEPARGCPRRILLTTTAFAACSAKLQSRSWSGLSLRRTAHFDGPVRFSKKRIVFCTFRSF